jgi:hypothetical protein
MNTLEAILTGGAILGTLRGQDKRLTEARRHGLQLAKHGGFSSYDEMMAYAQAHDAPIAHRYAGTQALDWLKTAALSGALVATGRPILATAGMMQVYDWQREKAARGEAFKKAFENNLPKV